MQKEATARIKINKLLEQAGWRLIDDDHGPANVVLENHVKMTKSLLDAYGNDFEKAVSGFSRNVEKELMHATSPFTFWRVNESSVMRFLKLVGCDIGKVGSYAALVQERNDAAHANGNIYLST